jgi:hypothetical protein
MAVFAIIPVGRGAQPIFYGNPNSPVPVTFANTSATGGPNIWYGDSQSVGPGYTNESTPIPPGGYVSLDGSQPVYYAAADAAGGQVTIYPGVTSFFLPVNLAILIGSQIILEGSKGQILIYSGIAAPGNLIGAWSGAAGTDGSGNPFIDGLLVGLATNPQIAIVPGNPSEIQFIVPPTSFFGNTANIAITNPSSNAEWEFSGPALAQSGFGDWVQQIYYSFTGASPSHMEFRYIDANGAPHVMLDIGYQGCMTLIAKTLTAVAPGTGTSQTNAATAESWHSMVFSNGWVNSIGTARYRLIPFGAGAIEVEGVITNPNNLGVGFSTAAVLPAAYIPTTQQFCWAIQSGGALPLVSEISLDGAGQIGVFINAAGANAIIKFRGIMSLD